MTIDGSVFPIRNYTAVKLKIFIKQARTTILETVLWKFLI